MGDIETLVRIAPAIEEYYDKIRMDGLSSLDNYEATKLTELLELVLININGTQKEVEDLRYELVDQEDEMKKLLQNVDKWKEALKLVLFEFSGSYKQLESIYNDIYYNDI